MNIISNGCFTAQFYKMKGIEFNNPFMWNQILPDDFIFLITNYDKIDFNEWTISWSNFFTRNTNPNQKTNFILKIVIDNSVTVHYVHYRYDKNAKTKIVKGSDVYMNKIEDYVKEKYTSRLERMLKGNEKPHFVITASEPEWTLEKQQKVCDLESDFKIVIFSDFPEKLILKNQNVLVKKLIRPIGTCEKMVSTYCNLILDFFLN